MAKKKKAQTAKTEGAAKKPTPKVPRSRAAANSVARYYRDTAQVAAARS